jgi:hypothetical protein
VDSWRITSTGPTAHGKAGKVNWGRIESVNEADSKTLGVSYAPAPSARGQRVTVHPAFAPGRIVFDQCPICLVSFIEDAPETEEHIPNAAIGGHRLTRTCLECNGGLGRALEGSLTSWVSESWRNVKVTAEGVRGARSMPRIDLRWTGDGEFALLVTGKIDPEIDAAMRRGAIELSMTIPLPDMTRVRLAALKHAYLAACLALGKIPAGPTADLMRGVLTFVRDFDGREKLPANVVKYAEQVELARTYLPPSTTPVVVMVRDPVPDSGLVEAWICLAGVLMVRWPLPEYALAVVAA